MMKMAYFITLGFYCKQGNHVKKGKPLAESLESTCLSSLLAPLATVSSAASAVGPRPKLFVYSILPVCPYISTATSTKLHQLRSL